MKNILPLILALIIAILSGTQLCLLPERVSQEAGTEAPTQPPSLTQTEPSDPPEEQPTAEQLITSFALLHGLRYSDYPTELIELLERNPETLQFVLEYPLKKDLRPSINLTEYVNSPTVPLFMQWDQRWGYLPYGDHVAGLTACGPVCLSMVAYYLTKDPNMSPDKLMAFATENGYCIPGNGTAWALIGEGGKKLGLDVEELPLHDGVMYNELRDGWPIICIMGPGDFTTTGHYIVITGLEDGAFRINDPNSYENSSKRWTYDQICDQINNLWVVRLP